MQLEFVKFGETVDVTDVFANELDQIAVCCSGECAFSLSPIAALELADKLKLAVKEYANMLKQEISDREI